MNDQLRQKLETLPAAPGIYQMLDEAGAIIYIGKSKCLKRRVNSYFVPKPKWEKAQTMQKFIADLEIIVTDTHLEAMLLECSRIKEVRPFFNVLMKNEGHYSYLTVGRDARKTPLTLSWERGPDSFGPLRSRGRAEALMAGLLNLYPLRKNRGHYQLTYHIFPQKLNREEFEENRSLLLEIFQEPRAMERFLRALERGMEDAAKNQLFERAGKFRDLREGFLYLQKTLVSYRELTERELLYQVPIPGGTKLFYIFHGMAAYAERFPETEAISEAEKQRFLAKARAHPEEALKGYTEKELIDFRDILYGELLHAPAGAVEQLS
ncbi:MAG: GIY-YIG nuclease family protein [Eubacteriales bacterium]|nr:GIY-YIG nuclease family protein [Eubacteriales bacterium]